MTTQGGTTGEGPGQSLPGPLPASRHLGQGSTPPTASEARREADSGSGYLWAAGAAILGLVAGAAVAGGIL
ncbi:membrane protein [Arthrobacter phage Bolt007]|uniref:Membrane protein n=1 Tax=Arthrobacter phage Bolt007 TaxID=3017297 RepID=A0AA49I6E5_9CAUD|nr:membrane protein [Arthrobacter phage Bolt007]